MVTWHPVHTSPHPPIPFPPRSPVKRCPTQTQRVPPPGLLNQVRKGAPKAALLRPQHLRCPSRTDCAISQPFARELEIPGVALTTAIIDLSRRAFNIETRARVHFNIRIRARIGQLHCPTIQSIHKYIHIHGTPSHFNSIETHSCICRWSYSHPSIFFKSSNIHAVSRQQNRKLQKIFQPTRHHLR